MTGPCRRSSCVLVIVSLCAALVAWSISLAAAGKETAQAESLRTAARQHAAAVTSMAAAWNRDVRLRVRISDESGSICDETFLVETWNVVTGSSGAADSWPGLVGVSRRNAEGRWVKLTVGLTGPTQASVEVHGLGLDVEPGRGFTIDVRADGLFAEGASAAGTSGLDQTAGGPAWRTTVGRNPGAGALRVDAVNVDLEWQYGAAAPDLQVPFVQVDAEAGSVPGEVAVLGLVVNRGTAASGPALAHASLRQAARAAVPAGGRGRAANPEVIEAAVPALGPGESAWVSWRLPVAPGDEHQPFQLIVDVDAGDLVLESDEANEWRTVNPLAAGIAATRTLPGCYIPGIPVLVSIAAVPPADSLTYAVQDGPPADWPVSAISHGGGFDTLNRLVKFGLFYDTTARTLTYQTTPPAGTSGVVTFAGTISVNGESRDIAGTSALDECRADLTLTKSAVGAFTVGGPGRYLLSVSNVGVRATTGAITVADALPAGLGYESYTGVGWTCSAAGALVTCTHQGPLPAGTSLPPLTLSVTIGAAAFPSVTNQATVSTPGDSVSGNNTGTATTAVTGPDLTLTKTHAGSFLVGTPGVYKLTVRNVGTAKSTGSILVTDTLPAGLTYLSRTGVGWTCAAVGQVVTCSAAKALLPGGSVTLSVKVNVAMAAVPGVVNTATVRHAMDGNAANDTATDPTVVVPVDLEGPALAVTSHTDGQTVSTKTILLMGTASDAGRGGNGILNVLVNGARAAGDTATGTGTANWSRTLSLRLGKNTVTILTRDNSPKKNQTKLVLTLYYVR